MQDYNYCLWGAGTYGARTIEFMKKDLTFQAIIDNNPKKQGTSFCGLPVISFDEAKKAFPESKIVLALNVPTVVRGMLLSLGLEENRDFYTLHDFIPRF